MDEYRLAKLGDQREGVTLGQDPFPQLSGRARLDTFRGGQKRIDARHGRRIGQLHFPFGPRASTVSASMAAIMVLGS